MRDWAPIHVQRKSQLCKIAICSALLLLEEVVNGPLAALAVGRQDITCFVLDAYNHSLLFELRSSAYGGTMTQLYIRREAFTYVRSLRITFISHLSTIIGRVGIEFYSSIDTPE